MWLNESMKVWYYYNRENRKQKRGDSNADETVKTLPASRLPGTDKRYVLHKARTSLSKGKRTQPWLQFQMAQNFKTVFKSSSALLWMQTSRQAYSCNSGWPYRSPPRQPKTYVGRKQLAEPVQAVSWQENGTIWQNTNIWVSDPLPQGGLNLKNGLKPRPRPPFVWIFAKLTRGDPLRNSAKPCADCV